MNILEIIRRRLISNVERANQVRARLMEAVSKGNGEAVYAIHGLQGKTQIFILGDYSAQLLNELNDSEGPDEERLQKLWQLVQYKVNCWRPEQSTSPYSNASNLEEFNALLQLSQELGK